MRVPREVDVVGGDEETVGSRAAQAEELEVAVARDAQKIGVGVTAREDLPQEPALAPGARREVARRGEGAVGGGIPGMHNIRARNFVGRVEVEGVVEVEGPRRARRPPRLARGALGGVVDVAAGEREGIAAGGIDDAAEGALAIARVRLRVEAVEVMHPLHVQRRSQGGGPGRAGRQKRHPRALVPRLGERERARGMVQRPDGEASRPLVREVHAREERPEARDVALETREERETNLRTTIRVRVGVDDVDHHRGEDRRGRRGGEHGGRAAVGAPRTAGVLEGRTTSTVLCPSQTSPIPS